MSAETVTLSRVARRAVLSDLDGPHRLAGGGADLFALLAEDGEPRGRHHPLFRLAEGDPIGPVPAGCGVALVAVLAPGARLEPNTTVEAWTARLAAALGPDGIESGLARLAERLRASTLAEAEDARRRDAVSAEALGDGLAALAALARNPAGPAAVGASQVDPTLAALRMIGDALGHEIAPPGPLEETEPVGLARAEAILRASGLRTRRVALTDGWWRRENGPLLAIRSADGGPIALLPTRGGYRAQDPAARTGWRVTAAEAAALEPVALMAYRALPDEPVRLGRLARIGLAGSAGDLWRAGALAAAVAALALVFPVASGLMVEAVIPDAARSQAGVLVAGLLAAAFGIAGFELTKALALLRVESRLDATIQAALFDRLLRLPVGFFRGFASGDLADRLLAVQAMRAVLAGTAVSSLLAGLFSLSSLILMVAYGGRLALLGVGVSLLAGAVTGVLTVRQLAAERRLAHQRGRVEGEVTQMVAGIGTLKVGGAARRAVGRWARAFARQKRDFAAARRAAGWQDVVQALLTPCAMAAVFLGAALLTDEGDGAAKAAEPVIDAGAFLAFNAAFGQLLASTTRTVRALAGALAVVPLLERARPILEALPERSTGGHAPGHLSGAIALRGVSFAYGPDGPPVLRDVSFSLDPGAFVAVAGASGSGKSTIIRLLLGFERPGAGAVLYDGKPLASLDVAAVRRQLGVVLQDGRIVPGTILGNVLGGLDAPVEDAWEALRLAGLEEEVRALPMGLHTVMMDGGATLSGGQRQRLLLARALVRRPRILLLDEATSALDNGMQQSIADTLAKLRVTRLVVAHRLSTIAKADRILVLDGGRIVQQGPFEMLLAEPGPFAALARRQTA